MTPKSKISGTREWAEVSANISTGCSHDCLYCYARFNAIKRYKIVEPGLWRQETVNSKSMTKKWGKINGRIMFPTTHDITPAILPDATTALENMLRAGNDILIVSKPHLNCIWHLCKKLSNPVDYRKQITFRFTIGACDDDILNYWEPYAPGFTERLASLACADACGFRTSVSCEPLLDPENVIELISTLTKYVNDSIWIGKLNHIDKRVMIETEEDKERVEALKAWQTDEKVKEIYEFFKTNPLIKWKESYKEIVGLELATEAGLDE